MAARLLGFFTPQTSFHLCWADEQPLVRAAYPRCSFPGFIDELSLDNLALMFRRNSGHRPGRQRGQAPPASGLEPQHCAEAAFERRRQERGFEDQRSEPSNPAPSFPADAPPSPAQLAEPPKPEFLAWQDVWETNQPGAPRHPDGSTVTTLELGWLARLQPLRARDSEIPEARFLHLWCSHPLFDHTSVNELALLDDKGDAVPLGSQGGAFRAAHGLVGNLGWLAQTICPAGAGSNFPPRVVVQLRYTIGPLENTREVGVPRELDIEPFPLEGNSRFDGLGEEVDGKAFVAIAADAVLVKSRRFSVVAVTKDGCELTTRGQRSGKGERYYFNVPLSGVAKFIIGTRQAGFPGVALPGQRDPESAWLRSCLAAAKAKAGAIASGLGVHLLGVHSFSEKWGDSEQPDRYQAAVPATEPYKSFNGGRATERVRAPEHLSLDFLCRIQKWVEMGSRCRSRRSFECRSSGPSERGTG